MTYSAPASPPRRTWKLVLGILALLLLLVIVLTAVRVVRAANAARTVMDELQALQSMDPAALADLNPVLLSQTQERFARVESNLVTIENQVRPFLPLTRYMGWLPRYRAEVQAAPDLLQLARGAATAGRAGMDAATVLATALHTEGAGSALARLTPALEQTQPSWQEVDAALQQVAAARSRLDVAALDPRLVQPLHRLDDYLPLLQSGSLMARLAPGLLGSEGSRTYLVLPQNSDELRPTGGFISGVGLLQLDRGNLTQLSFADSYTVFNPDIDHPLAPPDLQQTMDAQLLLFRDANWSVDFPTSASVAQSLYQLDMGTATDGVIAFDLEATQRMMTALEPLALPGYAEPLTAGNVLAAMRSVWNEPTTTDNTVRESGTSDWWLHRKDFMGDLAGAARSKLENGQIDMGKLARALYSSLQEKHLLIALNDRAGQAALEAAGWSGKVEAGRSDFLLVVDSNVGWNKVNSVVQRRTVYTVTPQADGSALATLDLIYRHSGEATGEPCVHVARYGDSYEDMVRRCYFDYLRVLVPAGAELLGSEGFETPATVGRGERATTQFAGSLIVPPGGSHQVRLSYRLLAGLFTSGYTLTVQKQPGTPPWPVQIVLNDPSGAWQPGAPGGQRTADGVQVSFDLARDTVVSMTNQAVDTP